jgi:autotransporter-associated beta strand protein
MSRLICRAAITACVVACAAAAEAAQVVDLGLSDEFTISQPVVQVQVGRFGALDLNEYLLDTGASGILAGAGSSAELRSKGLVTEATYVDFGVAGPQSTGVSAPYDFFYAGTDGVPRTLPAARMQTSNGNFAFYSGIAGMPLMTGRTVGFNLASQADMNDLRIGVAFDVPISPTLSAHQYSVPLTMYQFPATGQQNPTDPLPENAALPFASVKAQYGSTTKTANFLLDTGAQQCILSKTMALDLGLDVNGNGSLDDEALSFQTVAGVGGTVEIPVLRIDALSLRATNDVELLFHDITVGVIDIDPALPGVLGMNVLNSGWEMYALNTFLGMDPGPRGVFGRVDLDFRTAAASLQAEMRLSLDPGRDAFVSQGAIAIDVAAGMQTQAQAGHAMIGGTSSLQKLGAGTLVLDAVNTHTGVTTVQSGTTRIATPNALVGSPTVVRQGATLAIATGSGARLPSITLEGGMLQPGGVLAVNGTSGVSRLVVVDGVVEGQPALTIGSGGEVKIAGGTDTSLAVASLGVDQLNGGRLDLGLGRIEVAAGGITDADLLAGLVAGRSDGSWTGTTGIGSSAVAAAIAAVEPRSLGWIQRGDGSYLVAYAAPGDINLDGWLDILDASNFFTSGRFNTGLTGQWSEGDFNYDAVVDTLDVVDFLSTGLFDTGSYLSASPAAFEAISVPEPASAGALVAAAAAWVTRFCRRRS